MTKQVIPSLFFQLQKKSYCIIIILPLVADINTKYHHIVGIRMMKSIESKLVPIKVIVSLAVAESLLRRGICDVVFEEIVVDGGDYNG